MGVENKNDAWGLSLSLRPPSFNVGNQKTTCKRVSTFSIEEKSSKIQKPNESLTMTMTITMPKTTEMDVKPAPLVIDLEEMEKTKVCSPNSTLLSSNADAGNNKFGGFQGDRDVISDDDEGGSGGGSDGGRGRGGERKKLRLSKEQITVLERAFGSHTTLNTKQKLTLARDVKLKPRQVEVWFQNRRARTKLKQTEVDCEYLRKFSETLTEQNMKLQKEVQELRAALKMGLSDQSAMHGQIMCSSCKSVSLSPSFASSSKTPTAGVLHCPAPLNLKKLSLTINNNMFVSNLPRV